MEEKLPVEITVKNAGYINYTFCLNKLNFLYEVVIDNLESLCQNIKIEIRSDLGIFDPYVVHIDEVANGKIQMNRFDFNFNLSLLRNLTEKDLDTIHLEVYSKDEELAAKHFSQEILPIDYFGGLQNYPQLLASYVIPNHPVVYDLKTSAINILEERHLSPAFEGYQMHSKERVLQMVSALYRTVQNRELIYSAMPPSFEKTGQRIRLIDQVLETKFGNCIDISLLFAALLESVDLHPILILTKGHAFVGVWLDNQRFDGIINFDQAALSKRIAKGIREIAIIEMTTLCKGQNVNFNEAVSTAEVQLMNDDNFLMSIDIKSTRSYGVLPLPLMRDATLMKKSNTLEENNFSYAENEEFEIGETYEDLELTDLSNLTKQKIWERKLLDLSLRNNLLNLRFTKSMLQIIDLKINLLEDTLADGKTYSIMPDNSQSVIRKYSNYLPPLHPSTPLFRLADEEFKYNRLLTTYHNDDLENILTHLYRTSKLAEEENGKSTLYLGLGLLKWYDPRNKEMPRFAPILLVPVELSRKSVNAKFSLRSREEETMINITLVEYLKQEFQLNLNALEQLPMDELGVDVPKVLAILRNAVLNLEGWDVLEQIVLGIFSFNKLILWQDISKYSKEMQKSAIVKSLIDGKLSDSLESIEEDDLALEYLTASALRLPIPTDNSQMNAVKSANLGKTFILHGPPGTGKSQTITNIIADALSNNKKVLFVAAKKAALDVVHHRLESIGLGPFCLELHSNKSKKSDVLKQFETTLETPKYQLTTDFAEEAQRLDERKKELNKYVTFLHQKNKIGWSLYDSVSYLEQNGIAYNDELKSPVDFENLDSTSWNRWNDWLIPYSAVVQKIRIPKEHPLYSVKISIHQLDTKQKITQAIDEYQQKKQDAKEIFELYNIDPQNTRKFLDVLSEIQTYFPEISLLKFCTDGLLKRNLLQWANLNEEFQDIENQIIKKYNKNIFNLDFSNMSQIWNQSKFSWFLPKWLKQRKIKNILQGFSSSKIESEQQVETLFSQLNELGALKNNLAKAEYTAFQNLVEVYSQNGIFNATELKNDIQKTENLQRLLNDAGVEDAENWLTNVRRQHLAVSEVVQRIFAYNTVQLELEKYVNSVSSDDELQNIKNNLHHLNDWVNYQILKNKAKELGLEWFTKRVDEGVLSNEDINFQFYKILHFSHFLERVYSHEEIKTFDSSVYESLIQQYRELHKEFTNISKNQLIAKLSSNIPNFSVEAAQSSEVGILQKAIRSKGRGLSIRRLFDQIPGLIPRLKPCMLMSPISVAQYFDLNAEHFDLVIFDEASQLPTSEAISALARAKQAIIVGDPKQMPPTSFFASSKVDEDNMEMEDLESILEDCLALSIPSNYLLRHYRSKHESLISFSNKNFYESKLLTFPSPDDLNQKVTFEFVESFYDKGKTRTNKKEAEAVIQYIKNHLAAKNKKSIGVVTFSQTQQSLIEDFLQKLFVENPELESFALKSDEPIFVKNLENVQGDERDIILFSIGYGPDEEGKISMNFGPLNRDGGWRRLNVAVTRARYEMKVFSSLRGDQISLSRTKAEGVKGLKDFLNFAEKGNYALDLHSPQADRLSLVDSISDYLTENGLDVKKHIGTSEYKVDIGVVHPDNEKEYILGILVDGDNYYNIHTTNDRELLAPNVLKGLGWNVFRIWTIDWIKNKKEILEKIKCAIKENLKEKAIKKERGNDDTTENEKPALVEHLLVEVSDKESDLIIPYVAAAVEALPFANSESIYFLENRSVVLNQMKEIISVEAPISKNLLFKKMLKLWNTSRAGSKLNNHLSEILQSVPSIVVTTSHQEFIWNEAQSPNSFLNYRDNSIEKRSIEDISAEEIGIVALDILKNNLSMDKSDLIRLCSKAFGFMKVGSQIDAVINSVLVGLAEKAQLEIKEDRVVLK